MNPLTPPSAYHGQNDTELLVRMSTGDHMALADFYDRWARSVTALVVHIVRDADDADDVVEDTFWQAWRQAGRYEPSRGAVSTWLLTIARSRALDCMRARRRLREEPLTPLAVSEEMPPAAAMNVESDERRTIVRGALQTLPADQRQVLELAYFGGLSQTEIAERTGQPLGTVKTRTRLAAQKLRACLAILRDVGESQEVRS